MLQHELQRRQAGDGPLIAFVLSLDRVIARQTGSSGSWEYEEYQRLACEAVLPDVK